MLYIYIYDGAAYTIYVYVCMCLSVHYYSLATPLVGTSAEHLQANRPNFVAYCLLS